MSELVKRAWREPCVFLGLMTSAVLLVITVATGDPWDTAAIAGIAAPLLSALGIRELVTPAYDAPHHDPAEPSIEAQQIKKFEDG